MASPDPTVHTTPTRRDFIRAVAIGGAGAALGLTACSGGDDAPFALGDGPGPEPTATPVTVDPVTAAGPIEGRTLVVIELEGGNDGLDMVVPYNDPRYRDLRPNVGVDPATVLALDDHVGLNPNLGGLHRSGVAVIEGVGIPDPTLSHFESARRWWAGDMTGRSTDATGFLGRLCDQLSATEAVTGVSIGRGATPAMRSEAAVTLSVPDPWAGGGLGDPNWDFAATARQGLATMADTGMASASPLHAATAQSMTTALGFLDVLGDLPDHETEGYPGSQLGWQLQTCSRLLAGNVGVRVFHVPIGGFDTHADHRGTHDYLLMEIDEAVAAFRADLDQLGLSETTLIATTSEFGRRPAENDGGTDHGTAAPMLLAGPVIAGRHGLTPSLAELDDDGNLMPTVTLDEYYATLAEGWFGVPAGEVLPSAPEPIDGVIAPV